MKKLLSLIFLTVSVIAAAKAQHAIRASHVINHPGQQVVVVDSIYDVKMYNDSTAIIDMGARGDKAPLNIVLNFNSKMRFDPATLRTFNGSILEVTGLVLMVEDQPTIVVTDKEKLTFISGNANQTWQALSQLSYKKHQISH